MYHSNVYIICESNNPWLISDQYIWKELNKACLKIYSNREILKVVIISNCNETVAYGT